MNLFKNLRENYGQNTVRTVRELEKSERKIANYRTQLFQNGKIVHFSLSVFPLGDPSGWGTCNPPRDLAAILVSQCRKVDFVRPSYLFF